MPKLPDQSPEEILERKQQAKRLEHVRRAMGLSRTEAAEMAGVSRFTWRRMEEALAPIKTLPLVRFFAAYPRAPSLPAAFVLTGDATGYPTRLRENLEQLARAEPGDWQRSASDKHHPPEPSIEIARKRRAPGSRNNGPSQALEADEQEAA